MSGAAAPRAERWYATVWRWHFYAGLFTAPFILWLSATGALYLFKPQIEAWQDRPYDSLQVTGPPATPSQLARAAEDAVPGSVLHRFTLPAEADDAQRVIVGVGAVETRVYLHPQTGAVLHQVAEEARLMRIVSRLHGELKAGRPGSALVELAASWAVILLLSGLFLWWPRGRKGLGGVLWPRLNARGRIMWRDLHAVTGFWVSLAAAFLILSGLPWAMSWSNYLTAMREVTGQSAGPVDWSQGSTQEAAERVALDAAAREGRIADPDAGHAGHAGHGQAAAALPSALDQLDRVVPVVATLDLAGPVQISPPAEPGSTAWLAASESANRPLRDSVEVDGVTGRVIGGLAFAQRHPIDRAVGYGIAIHEGALFGLANQLLGLAVVIALALMSVAGLVLWWRRRPAGRLGAPPPQGQLRHSWALVALTVLLGFAVPLFGVSLALLVALEQLVLRRSARASRFLGLRAT
ncbi:PepSY-associated TM helix domain-containing protein [Croceibacterium ferulae]|uniref:PepSY-associated TM helix domain-containing protein n=1 Tax=Croceibacterium ferulae TaxID=1854641 RepID=UPI001F4DCF13|nr:PepSY domain-containing protein [Croceibacterium ferulae]